jgi:integrase
MLGAGGTKTFYVYRKVDGRPQRVKLGRFGDISIEQARKLAGRTTAKIAEGIDPMAEKRRQRAGETLGTLFTFYMETHARVHKKSWRGDEATYRRYLKRWSNRKLADIERRDVQALHVKVGMEHGHYAANRMLALLSKMFNVARNAGHEGNPANGVQRFKEQSRDRFMAADELPKFFAALNEEPNEPIREYIMVALLTGGRRSNVMGMRWADVNLDRAVWTIPHEQAKGGVAMTLPLSPPVLEILRQRLGNDPIFVFPSHGKSGHLEDIKYSWKRILSNAGIGDLRLHDLRRTLGSWQAATGASLPVIGKSLGHKNTATTAIYARLNLDPVRQSVDTATAAMLATVGKEDAARSD